MSSVQPSRGKSPSSTEMSLVALSLPIKHRTTKKVAALHKWFDAKLLDHGSDAMAGHQLHHDMSPQKLSGPSCGSSLRRKIKWSATSGE